MLIIFLKNNPFISPYKPIWVHRFLIINIIWSISSYIPIIYIYILLYTHMYTHLIFEIYEMMYTYVYIIYIGLQTTY